MSVHPSLGSKGKGKANRSVLKRFERLKALFEKEKWSLEDSVFGLPKLKTLRWKIKKAKKAAEAEGEAVAGATEATAGGAPKAGAAEKAPTAKKEKTDKK